MNVLFFTHPKEDYLADGLLHGFRSLFGKSCVDFPKNEIMYKGCSPEMLKKVRGNGFTLYTGLLEDIEIDRFDISAKIRNGYFDLIVFSNIQRQFGLFTQYRPWLKKENTVILDGEDTLQPYPARGLWWRRPYYWFLPRAHKRFLYFKREWAPGIQFSFLLWLLPLPIRKLLPYPANMRKISFSFPAEKIISKPVSKTKLFPIHIVDKELSSKIEGSSTSYAFGSEAEYYHDLQVAQFGITTKRAGWDCLRHYEIAANGGVICFKELDRKPEVCAPHDLDESNAVIYKNGEDLLRKVSEIDPMKYQQLQDASLKWVRSYSTVEVAKRVIAEITKLKEGKK
jgi:hypothetical protein